MLLALFLVVAIRAALGLHEQQGRLSGVNEWREKMCFLGDYLLDDRFEQVDRQELRALLDRLAPLQQKRSPLGSSSSSAGAPPSGQLCRTLVKIEELVKEGVDD